MQLSSEELKKLQNVCLELACEVDRVCRKNNIEYTLEGGTLIGAVREHGFIAWDDDVDISMSRKEFSCRSTEQIPNTPGDMPNCA